MWISYNQAVCIKQDVTEAVRKIVQNDSDVFIPSYVKPFRNVFFLQTTCKLSKNLALYQLLISVPLIGWTFTPR